MDMPCLRQGGHANVTIATLPPRATRAAKPRLAIARDRYHRYTHEGVVYRGTTSIIGVLDKSDALMPWAAKQTATAAVGLVNELPAMLAAMGPDGVISALTKRSAWERDKAADIGSSIHEWADRIALGEATEAVPADIRERVEAYAYWWVASGWKRRLTEACVVSTSMGYGGTLDILAFDEHGRTVLGDVKSGRNVYAETKLQLAAYGMAELIAPPGSEVAYPMPKVDRYVVIHVTDAGVRPVEVDVTDEDRDAFRACIVLDRWRESRGKERL